MSGCGNEKKEGGALASRVKRRPLFVSRIEAITNPRLFEPYNPNPGVK